MMFCFCHKWLPVL